MGNIAALPTLYDGITFRSRIEARWALFFNMAGISYEYEPEAYKFTGPDGYEEAYLVDFYLPSKKVFVEIKGGNYKDFPYLPSERIHPALEKCGKLARRTDTNVLLLAGPIPNLSLAKRKEWLRVHFGPNTHEEPESVAWLYLLQQNGCNWQLITPEFDYYSKWNLEDADSLEGADPFFLDCESSYDADWLLNLKALESARHEKFGH